MTSDAWLCCRHERKPRVDLSRQPSLAEYEVVQASNHNQHSLITVCSCRNEQVLTFEKMNVTSAQVNPIRPWVAVSTCSVISVYDVHTNARIKSARFPCEPLFWTWINSRVIGVVSDTGVYNWSCDTDDEIKPEFVRDERTRRYQVTNYAADDTMRWFAVSSLFADNNGQFVVIY